METAFAFSWSLIKTPLTHPTEPREHVQDLQVRRVLVAGGAEDSFDQVFDRFTATFRSDNDAGVED
jgi:hypothetical protein